MILLCFIWTTADTINSLILIVYTVTAYFIYNTLKVGQRQLDEGQKQFEEGQKLTKTSLALSQFNIYNDELKNFINDAKNIKFQSSTDENTNKKLKQDMLEANGIFYISLFSFIYTAKVLLNTKDDEESRKVNETVSDFRHNVLFPLERFYDRLLHFLNSVKKDLTMEDSYKQIIYTKVERDLLQTYFRICNYKILGEKLDYDLVIFDTTVYNSKSFYRINQFYIDNTAFNYKDLTFYNKTT